MTCPHCTNTDTNMMEVLKGGIMLCYVCSKKFEVKIGRNPEPIEKV